MKLFYSNAAAKEEIGKLETENSELKTASEKSAAEITRLEGELKAANEATLAMTKERDEANSAFEESERKSVKLTEDLSAANDKLATFDADVETAAAARFAGLGGDPIPESSNQGEKKIISMADFNAMTPAARMGYVKSGGKLKD